MVKKFFFLFHYEIDCKSYDSDISIYYLVIFLNIIIYIDIYVISKFKYELKI
jgi:hypothetical protein